MLIVAPHPDDEVAGCGGALLLHKSWGEPVAVLHVTDGGRSTALGLAPRQMAEVRRQEAMRVARWLALEESHWLGLPEREWRPSELALPLRELLDRFRPDLVYAPSPVDFHPDHLKVSRCVAASLTACGHPPLARLYPVQVPLTACLTNVVAPVDAVADSLRRAMQMYGSQLGSLERCLRLRRYAALSLRLGGLTETFWQLEAAQLLEVARLAEAVEPRRAAYRGLRSSALTDPLAYLVGRRARGRLLDATRNAGSDG